jgi:hypothetical protein
LINYTRSWNKKISDPVVWPEVYRKIKKYKPFVNFDQQKVKKLVVDKFTVWRYNKYYIRYDTVDILKYFLYI